MHLNLLCVEKETNVDHFGGVTKAYVCKENLVSSEDDDLLRGVLSAKEREDFVPSAKKGLRQEEKVKQRSLQA